jgi:Zn-finger nucleic acid-binding protein
VSVGDVGILECTECDGLWLDAAAFERICADREAQAAVIHGGEGRTPGIEKRVSYRPCVRCGTMMNRVNFARLSGTIVDVCKGHGTFLDAGELQAIVGFIQGGGLDRARQRQIEDLKEQERRLKDQEARALSVVSAFWRNSVSFRLQPDVRASPTEGTQRRLERLGGLELQRDAVDAVAQASRRRAIGEHVPKVAAAAAAVDLGAHHEVGAVLGRADRALERREEARPAGAALELAVRHEERLTAGHALERARALLLEQRAGARALGPVLAQHLVLLGCQLRAPFCVGFGDRKFVWFHKVHSG